MEHRRLEKSYLRVSSTTHYTYTGTISNLPLHRLPTRTPAEDMIVLSHMQTHKEFDAYGTAAVDEPRTENEPITDRRADIRLKIFRPFNALGPIIVASAQDVLSRQDFLGLAQGVAQSVLSRQDVPMKMS